MSASVVQREEMSVVDPRYGSCPRGHDKDYDDKGRISTFHARVDIASAPYCGQCGRRRQPPNPTKKVWHEVKIVCDGCGTLLREWKHEGEWPPPKSWMSGACSQCGTHFGPIIVSDIVWIAIVAAVCLTIALALGSGWFSVPKNLREQYDIPVLVNETYPITVNYDLSLAAMVGAGQYNWVHLDITEKNFPVSKKGIQNVTIEVIQFDRAVRSEEVLPQLDRRGLRPATIEELLALGAKYPEMQQRFSIAAFGSIWKHPPQDPYVPYLFWNRSEGRFLSFCDIKCGWQDSRFAAVRR